MSDKKEEIQDFIYEQFENGEWVDFEDKISEIIDESFSQPKSYETYLFSSLSALGLFEEKINLIKLKFDEFITKEDKEDSFQLIYSDYLTDYPNTCELIKEFNFKTEKNDPQKVCKTIFNFLQQNKLKNVDTFLKQLKVETGKIEQIKVVFSQENSIKISNSTVNQSDSKILSIEDKILIPPVKFEEVKKSEQNFLPKSQNNTDLVQLSGIDSEKQSSDPLNPQSEILTEQLEKIQQPQPQILSTASKYEETPQLTNLLQSIKRILSEDISIQKINILLDAIHSEEYKDKTEQLYEEWNVLFDQSMQLDNCIEEYLSQMKQEEDPIKKKKIQFFEFLQQEIKASSSIPDLPMDFCDQIAQICEEGNITSLFTKYKITRKAGIQIQQQWKLITQEESQLNSSLFSSTSTFSLINKLEDSIDKSMQESSVQDSIIREQAEKIQKEEEEKKALLQKIQEMELERKQKEIQDKLNLENQKLERDRQEQERRQREEAMRKEIEETRKERERKLQQEKEKEQKELEKLNQASKEEQLLVNELLERTVSDEFQILYQQEDNCLSQTSLKIICDKEQVKKNLSMIEDKQIKTIGFFGDFKYAVKIIKQMYPSASRIFLPDRIDPKYDKLITFSDGQNLFILLEDTQGSFEGRIYDNDDGLILIRYLLDTCTIVIACLNNTQIQNWTDLCPYEEFAVSLPPKIVRDRSIILCNKLTTKVKEMFKQSYSFQLFSDNFGTIPTWISQESSIMDRLSISEAEKKIFENRNHVLNYVNNIFYKYKYDKSLTDLVSNVKNISQVFLKNSTLSTEIQQLFTVFQRDCINHLKDYEIEEKSKPIFIPEEIDYASKYSKYICKNCIENSNHKNKNTCYWADCFFDDISFNFEKQCSDQRTSYTFGLYNQTYTNYTNSQLYELYKKNNFLEILSKDSYNLLTNYPYQQGFIKSWGIIKSELKKIKLPKLSSKLLKQFMKDLTLETHLNTFKQIQYNEMIEQQIIKSLREISQTFLSRIDQIFETFKTTKYRRITIKPLTINYDQQKAENYISPIKQLEHVTAPDIAHTVLNYISFDENVDYLLTINSNEPLGSQRITIWSIKKKVNSQSQVMFNQVFTVASNDIAFYLNRLSKQWVIFDNLNQKGSIGKINSNYGFEEGRLEQNVYKSSIIGYKDKIKRVDRCITLYEIDSTIFLYEKETNMHFEYSLTGRLQVKEFKLYFEINNKLEENLISVISFCNNSENDIYVFETENELVITNPNYIQKAKLKIDRSNFGGYKLVETDLDLILIISDLDLNITSFALADGEESQVNTSVSNIKDLPEKNDGNIVLDKLLRAVQYYGQNYTDLGCPNLNYLLVAFEGEEKSMEKRINDYMAKGFDVLTLSYKLSFSEQYNYSSISSLIKRIVKLNKLVEPIPKDALQMIMLSRIPIQISTIQQSSYIPQKDGIFQQEFLEINGETSQVEFLKNNLSFGWFEDVFYQGKGNLDIVSICGRQSVGKSSQLNRMFGTRFGVSAARCTDGVWLGFSKVGNDYIIVLDCEGLFSIRRTEDEEVKLLQQITLISSVSIIFCDLEGVSQPLLDLFKKLSMCVGKKKGEGIYFQGTLLFLTKNIQDLGDQLKIKKELEIHLNQKQVSITMSSLFNGGISYGFLKPFLTKDFDTKLKQFRNDAIFRDIIQKQKKQRTARQTVEYLKYALAQIYLDDDTDVEVISIMDSLRFLTDEFKEILLDLTKSNFPEEKFVLSFSYKNLTDSLELINKKSKIIKSHNLDLNFNQVKKEDNNQDISEETTEQNKEVEDDEQDSKEIKELDINFDLNMNQYNLIMSKHEEINFMIEIPKNRMLFEDQFRAQFSQLQNVEHNNYYKHLQEFLKLTLSSRISVVQQYFFPKFPIQLKFADISDKFKMEFQALCNELNEEIQLCLKNCKQCDRVCIKKTNHKSNCDCYTNHQCVQFCEICKTSDEDCFLSSGHSGLHVCKDKGHLCGEACKISRNCKKTCKLDVCHDPSLSHSCQEKHQCLHQCRQYDKCGKTCSLLSDHDEEYHICESEICFDKCSLCSNQCQIPLHDHDLLLKDIKANSQQLEITVKDSSGNIITIQAHNHICGQQHPCVSKCQGSGVCKVIYEQEEKIWENKESSSKFPYIFFKPIESKNECTQLIPEWAFKHGDIHKCSDSKNHRCDAQCQECSSFCSLTFGHSGNHTTPLHRNKENCMFVHENESEKISVKSDSDIVREYRPGELSNPETCSLSCVRQGRGHYHLKVCLGGNRCAEKSSSFAKHSKEKYYPNIHLQYDLILCKQYWELQGWDPPVSKEIEAINQLCNWACTHDSHSIKEKNMNYCKLKAFHSEPHDIDVKQCLHLATSSDIDICFAVDLTGSMGWAMREVKKTIEGIIKKFEKKSENIRFALVGYKDHPPEDPQYASKVISNLVDEAKFIPSLSGMEAGGGGDTPESVMDGLRDSCRSITWREKSQRFLFHIGDAPPHGKEYGCSSSNPEWNEKGCPCGIKKEDIAVLLREKEISYYLVAVGSSLNMMASLFKGSFGANFKQIIDLKKTEDLQILVLEALIKECKFSQELYHVS